MAQQNAGTMQETLAPVARRTQQGFRATKDWFGERSTMQWILMILVPILLVSTILGLNYYRNREGSNSRRRAARTATRSRRVGTTTRRTTSRRRRAGRRVSTLRARGRRTRVRGGRTPVRGRATPSTQPAGA